MLNRSLVGLVVSVLSACGDAGGPTDDGNEPAPTIVYRVEGAGGGSINNGTSIVPSIRVRVRVPVGAAVVPHAVVRYTVTGGTLAAPSDTTGDDGEVVAVWTVPFPVPTVTSLSACSTDPPDAPCIPV